MPSETPLQLAIFDCDGTLVDSQHSIITAMNETCKFYKIDEIGRDSIRRIVGLPLEVGMAQLFENQLEIDFLEMAETYRHQFRQMRLHGNVDEPLYDGTIDALDQLERDGWLLGVATGKAMRGLLATLKTHDLENRFVTLQTPDNARGKPDPEMVEKALGETGVDAHNAVVIGDTTYDIHMARNAKVKSIGVAWGYHETNELLNAGAALVVQKYSQLPQAIKQVMEAG